MSIKSETDELKTALFDLAAITTFAIITTVLRGVVLSYLWEWFIVPFGIPSIGIAHALGVSTIVGFLTYHDLHLKQETHPKWTRLTLSLVFPIFIFVFGYLYHLYV